MGIPDLKKLLKEEAPNCMHEIPLKEYRGQKVAIDANIVFFQFMATNLVKLKSKSNKPTGHLLGFLQRTAKFLSLQMDPIYIFDGDTLKMKQPEVQRRRAEKYGNVNVSASSGRKSEEALERYTECKTLLSLMGVPCFKALDEGEAQCCHLCKTDQVNAVASEDTDCLAYGAKKVLMDLKASKEKAVEYDHKMMLDDLGLTKDSFIDFCILAGCDYCDRVEGMNGGEALELLRQFGTIEDVLKNIDRKKYKISEKWPAQYKDARLQFTEPRVKNVSDDELKTKYIDEEALKLYLVTVHDFAIETIDKSLSTIRLASKQDSSPQRSTQPSTQRSKQGSTPLITQYFLPKSKRSSEKGTGEGESSKRSKP